MLQTRTRSSIMSVDRAHDWLEQWNQAGINFSTLHAQDYMICEILDFHCVWCYSQKLMSTRGRHFWEFSLWAPNDIYMCVSTFDSTCRADTLPFTLYLERRLLPYAEFYPKSNVFGCQLPVELCHCTWFCFDMCQRACSAFVCIYDTF